jgi:CRISPR/Cas system CSM-associated protein Csm4 (group 5 of RAMP superfamily)
MEEEEREPTWSDIIETCDAVEEVARLTNTKFIEFIDRDDITYALFKYKDKYYVKVPCDDIFSATEYEERVKRLLEKVKYHIENRLFFEDELYDKVYRNC